MSNALKSCPCGTGASFDACCGPFISGAERPDTAQALMRSRYTAFTTLNDAYLLATWDPATRPPSPLTLDTTKRWLGLRVRRAELGQPDDETGLVEYIARYRVQGRGYRLHEISRFRREGHQWLYIDGQIKS